MRAFLITLFLLSFLFSKANEKQIKRIQEHLNLSEEAATKTFRGDKAIFHAVQAENLFLESNIQNPALENQIQLKFIGAFRLVKQPENARKHLKRLLQLYIQQGQFATQGFLLNAGRLASDYLRNEELDSAQRYFELARQSAEKYGKRIYRSSTLNNIGMFYERKNNWEEAIHYYNEALVALQAKTEQDSAFMTSIRDNIANYFFQVKDSTQGIKLLQSNLNYLTQKPGQYKRVVSYSFKLFDVFVQRNNWIEAERLLIQLKSFLQFGRHDWYNENLIHYHASRIKLLTQKKATNKLLQAYQILDSLKNLQLEKKEEQKSLLNATMANYFSLSADLEIEREKEKAAQAKQDNDRKSLFIAFLILVFVVLSILIRSSSKRKLRAEEAERKIKEQALQLSKLENERLSIDLQHTSNDFSDLMMQSSLKEDWGNELIMQLEDLLRSDHKDPTKLKGIIRGLKQKSGVYDKVNLKQKGITEVNSAFFDHLDEKYPKLTKSERELCGLIRLRLDGKEIAVIRNIHPSSVRKLRHRLRKKLEISAEVDIYEFIAKI